MYSSEKQIQLSLYICLKLYEYYIIFWGQGVGQNITEDYREGPQNGFCVTWMCPYVEWIYNCTVFYFDKEIVIAKVIFLSITIW